MSKYKKPNWYPDADVIANERGWVYPKNHNEVLSAIGQLDTKLVAEAAALALAIVTVPYRRIYPFSSSKLAISVMTLVISNGVFLDPTPE